AMVRTIAGGVAALAGCRIKANVRALRFLPQEADFRSSACHTSNWFGQLNHVQDPTHTRGLGKARSCRRSPELGGGTSWRNVDPVRVGLGARHLRRSVVAKPSLRSRQTAANTPLSIGVVLGYAERIVKRGECCKRSDNVEQHVNQST